jgi:hypothetical protein
MGEICRLGISLDFVVDHPGCHWTLASREAPSPSWRSRFSRWWSSFFRPHPSAPRRDLPDPSGRPQRVPRQQQQSRAVGFPPPLDELGYLPAEEDRLLGGGSERGLRPEAEPDSEGELLLANTKARLHEELRQRTAARVGELRAETLRMRRRPASLPESSSETSTRGRYGPSRNSHMTSAFWGSSSDTPFGVRRGQFPGYTGGTPLKFYAVRQGRRPGIYYTWPECEQQVKGIRSEFKSFKTYELAVEWYNLGRPSSMPKLECRVAAIRTSGGSCERQLSSFVGGTTLRARLEVYQDGHGSTVKTQCGLDSMSDINLASSEFLHDVCDTALTNVFNCGSSTAFTREGVLKALVNGEVVAIPALVATYNQLPHGCGVLLGIPGLDSLGVQLDDHRRKQLQPLICHVGERSLRAWWEAKAVQSVENIIDDVEAIDVNLALSTTTKDRIRGILKEYGNVFEGKQVTLPKPFAAAPIELKFVNDPVPQSVPEPRWTFAQKNIITQWAEAGLKDGSLELSTSQ